ncbi:hypothetical protein [Aureimonas populi]|uniref:Mur ligase n=1 Tax=Aureimonas populi TaxID=1701758 RepID=A0ABW5CMG8_9HYPH|nr:hypothetical protein [Aureimonas populi]
MRKPLSKAGPVPLAQKLSAVRAALRARPVALQAPYPAVTLFFSVCDGFSRARVVNASGPSLESAWQSGLSALRPLLKEAGLQGRWVRVDRVEGVKETNWKQLRAILAATKRNYFRHGLALDAGLANAFLEEELNANAMLYGGNAVEHAVLNERNFSLYARARYPGLDAPGFRDEAPVFVLSTRGVFCDEAGRLHELNGPGPNAGRRHVERLDEAGLLSMIEDASAYLARQVKADGSFVYGWHPCFDRPIGTYNTLRHASTTYAMVEAFEVTRDARLGAAIERSLAHLTGALIHTRALPGGGEAAFLVDTGDEIKLGGNAVAILALAKHAQVTGARAHLPLMEKLALGIAHMQDKASGAFVHVLKAGDLSVKQGFRTIYYEGEAAFALMRLYALTKDSRWLAMVERAFEHFIAQEHWKHHDHWLGYCVDELTRHRPEERYFRFAIRNVADHLDFVANRITTFPTLLELMMAARRTLARIDSMPQMRPLLAQVDLVRFEAALQKRAHHLLNGHFWPELAMFFRKPDRIAGSFFIRHHAFRVRIDDVEHYLSGFVAYWNDLSETAMPRNEVAIRRPAGAQGIKTSCGS